MRFACGAIVTADFARWEGSGLIAPIGPSEATQQRDTGAEVSPQNEWRTSRRDAEEATTTRDPLLIESLPVPRRIRG